MAVSVAVEPPLGWITVDRPEAKNAMTFAMYEALFDGCETLDADESVRVVIMRGGGGTFVAGTDIREFLNLRTSDDALAYERMIDRVVGRLEQMSTPTIAMIEGDAVGGGFTMAAACDLRYASATARLGVPIARTLGNCLSMGNYARTLDLVGPARLKELLFTARLLAAPEAQAIGIVNEVVPAEALETRVREVATAIASMAPLTVQVSKEAIRRIHEHRRVPDGADLIARCYTSEDFQGAVRAFLEKRKPVWTGR